MHLHLHDSDKKPSRAGIKLVVRRAFCVMLIALLVVSTSVLSGCKYTDVLTQHIEDPVNGTLDQNAKPIYKDVANAKKANRVSTHEGKTRNKDRQKQQKPQYSKNAKSDQKTDKRKQTTKSSHDQNATEGTKTSQKKTGRTKQTDKTSKSKRNSGTSQKSSKSKAKSKTSKANGSTQGKGKAKNNKKTKTASNGGKGKIYSDGTYQTLPSNVKTVAAAGQYASLVQMFAGQDGRHLVAADSAWLARAKKFGAFKGEGIEKVKTGWSSSDNGQNSSGSAANADVNAIIKAKPDVVLVDGNDEDSNLSSGAKKKLTKAGVDVLTMPQLGTSFTCDADIKQAAKIVGRVLSDKTGGYSKQMADAYISYHDQLISSNGDYWYKPGKAYRYQKGESKAGNAQTGAVTTAFVDHMAKTNSATTKADRMYSPYGGSKDDALYLNGETIDVRDGVGMSIAGTGYALMDYYLQLAGVVDNSYEDVQPATKAYPIVAGQDAKGLVDGANRQTPSALWYAPYTDAAVQTVGDEVYPAIVSRDRSIATTIKTSANRPNGLYNVGQAYDIYVMPEGMSGNWADGTVESFLIQPWANACLTSSSVSSSNKNAVRESAQSFYETFYRASGSTYNDWLKNRLFDCVHVSEHRS